MPTGNQDRRLEIAWQYELPEGKHQVKIKLLNPKEEYKIWAGDLVIYSSTKTENAWITEK
jgi:hypothetical protein